MSLASKSTILERVIIITTAIQAQRVTKGSVILSERKLPLASVRPASHTTSDSKMRRGTPRISDLDAPSRNTVQFAFSVLKRCRPTTMMRLLH